MFALCFRGINESRLDHLLEALERILAMNTENRLLVIDELVEFEKQLVHIQDLRDNYTKYDI